MGRKQIENVTSLEQAVDIIEPIGDERYAEAEELAAWQYLLDSGKWKYLQGFYGRTLALLLEQGLIDGVMK